MSHRIAPSLLVLAIAPFAASLFAADQPTNAELQQKIDALDQQIRILGRQAELAKEDADAAAAKVKAAIKPADFQVKVKGYIQGRATLGASATNGGTGVTAGNDQDYFNGASSPTVNSASDSARFAFRRVRLSADVRTASDWFGLVTLRADNVGTSGTASTGGAAITLYQAYFGKTFKSGDFENEIKFGLDKIYNNDSSISSAAGLLAVDRPLATLLSSQREIGLAYQFRAPFLRAGVDVQDNANLLRTTAAAPADGNSDRKPGLATSFRIEGSPGADYLPAKKQESYVGAIGTQVLFGFDYQNSGKSYAVSNEARTLSLIGPDVLVHHDDFTFLAEWRASRLSRSETGGAPLAAGQIQTLDGSHWDAQLGYVLPLDLDFKIEPAIRFSVSNWSSDNDERSSWGSNSARDNNVTTPTGLLATGGLTDANVGSGATNLGSGSEVDLGVNLYWNGHANKTQFSYTSWKAEDGDGRASAVVVQHQVQF
jgi:hypothetical protein